MTIPFDPRHGLIIVHTRLWGPAGDVVVRLALDTGATGTMLNWSRLLLIGFNPAKVQERVQVTTGSGVEYAPRLAVRQIEALARKRRNFPVICHTLPPTATVDGVLGLDFLRRRHLVVDFREGWLSLK